MVESWMDFPQLFLHTHNFWKSVASKLFWNWMKWVWREYAVRSAATTTLLPVPSQNPCNAADGAQLSPPSRNTQSRRRRRHNGQNARISKCGPAPASATAPNSATFFWALRPQCLGHSQTNMKTTLVILLLVLGTALSTSKFLKLKKYILSHFYIFRLFSSICQSSIWSE